jgi:kynurenine formamidase
MKKLFALTLFVIGFGSSSSIQAQHEMNQADFDRVLKEISNGGRGGASDQLGALNLITPAKRLEAVKLVKLGVSVSMARTPETQRAPDNPNPFEHTMLAYGKGSKGMFAADHYSVIYHGFAHTHMDSLCHFFYNDKVYNGYSRDVVTKEGALKLGIQNLKDGVLSRGILMDIPRLKGKKYLEPGEAIYPEDLDAWEKQAGFKVSSGDVLLIRTGRWTRRAEKGAWPVSDGMPGLHGSCGKWLKERDIAILGSDGASDVMPSQVPGVNQPIHLFALHALGVHILDNCDFEAVAEKAAELGRWEFMLTASPIPVQGGTGSPLNPIATF